MEIKKEIRISDEASVKDQSEVKKLNPKLQTLNSKQTQNPKLENQNKKFEFLIRVLSLFRIEYLGLEF
jgi:hypothetical protein